jgi:hypothetical protein
MKNECMVVHMVKTANADREIVVGCVVVLIAAIAVDCEREISW